MIRATAGNIVNYATTFVFQILFAFHYGTDHAAAGFVVTFGIGAAITGLLVSSIQSTIIPRLLAIDGAILRESLRFLALVSSVSVGLFAALFITADLGASVLHVVVGLSANAVADLLRLTAIFFVLQFIAGAMISVALSRGDRLAPAIAPAFPSITAAVGLLAEHEITVNSTYALLVVGGVLEIVFLILTVRRPIHIASGQVSGLGAAVLLMGGIYTLLSVLPPYERISAARISAAGAAQYDYALRSLRAVQQLILGGVYLAALGDWSASSRRGLGDEMRQSLSTALIVIGNLLVACSCVALVAGQNAVSVIFQHGQFTAADTTVVTSILLIALPGFWAEGTGLMITSMLLARRKNGVLAAVGVTNFASRAGLIALFAPHYGARGVAIAYSIESVAILVVLMILATRLSLLSRAAPILRNWAQVGGVPIVIALAAMIALPSSQRVFAVVPVIGIFIVLLRALQPRPVSKRASRAN